MLVAESNASPFVRSPKGFWHFARWSHVGVIAGVVDRQAQRSILLEALPSTAVAEAEQVHGASLAMLEAPRDASTMIAGCDALVTHHPGLTLLVRSADCLPVFFVDPVRRVVALAHVGWRGLKAALPQRVVAALRHTHHSAVSQLHVAIGPAIRACCYEVGPEFCSAFEPFVRRQGNRLMCDLVGAAIDQLRRCGISSKHVVDCQRCTACETQRWFSLRREGPTTGRLVSFIQVRAG